MTKAIESKTVRVRGSDHDMGAKSVEIIREAGERAEWSANFMRSCGYRTVEVLAA